MAEAISLEEQDLNFPNEVAGCPGGEHIKKCFACGTCTISCPVFEIDSKYNPRKIIRMILMGMKNELISSETIWLCANCYTCFERCPQDVKFTDIIHVLRIMAMKEAKEGKIKLTEPAYYFANAFMNSVKLHGRMWEPELMARLFFRTMDVKKMASYVPLALKMASKGKISYLPSRINGTKEIRRIFKNAKQKAKTS